MNSDQPNPFFFPNIEVNNPPTNPVRAMKPGGFRLPLVYFGLVVTAEPATSIPHWHPNADEVAIFVDGEGTVVMTQPKGNEVVRQDVRAGDIFIFPRGYAHQFINKKDENHPLKFIAVFDNPEFTLVETSDIP